MKNKRFTYLRFILLIITGFCLLSPDTLAQTPKQMTTFSNSDYSDYKKSGLGNASCDDFVKEAFDAFDKENLALTVEMLRKATNLGCNSPIISFKMALAYESQGAFYSAIQYYELARDQFKKSNSNHRYAALLNQNYARALFSMGQVDKSVSLLNNECESICPAWALKLLAQNKLSQNDLNGAVKYIEKLITAEDVEFSIEDKKELIVGVARLFANQNDTEKANKYYKQLTEFDPSNTEASRYLNQKTKTKPKAIPSDEKWDQYDKVFDLLNNK